MKQLQVKFKTLVNMTLAGVCISLGAYAYLINPNPLGAILFSIGLMAVIHYKFGLYTGAIHTVNDVFDGVCLLVILAFNIIGCWLSSFLVSDPDIIQQCEEIVMQREQCTFIQAIANGMGCGFIITLAVLSWNQNKWALLVGIPAFILAGFTHSIADAFYYTVGWKAISWSAIWTYCGTVIGNFIGGSIYKLGTSAITSDTH